MTTKYDLHSHSYFSDGALSPTQLLEQAKEIGISHLALTDHDTTNGLSEARLAAQQNSIELINGVELSCNWNFQLLHVVGLNIDPQNDLLRQGIEQNRVSRIERAEAMFADFEKHDIDLREAVAAQLLINQKQGELAVPTRPHFAQALVDAGFAKNKKQAFKRYLVRGKPGFIAMSWPSVQEVGRWITASGGVAVLAHPMRYKFTRSKLIRLIEEMRPAGVHGIEVSTTTTDPQQTTMLAELAKKYDLFASLGSDFHSNDQPWARLGGARPLPEGLTPVWKSF